MRVDYCELMKLLDWRTNANSTASYALPTDAAADNVDFSLITQGMMKDCSAWTLRR